MPKDPLTIQNGGNKKRYPNEEKLIGYGQINNVHVSDCLHLGEAEHHVDDQGVSDQAHHADHHEEDGLDGIHHPWKAALLNFLGVCVVEVPGEIAQSVHGGWWFEEIGAWSEEVI